MFDGGAAFLCSLYMCFVKLCNSADVSMLKMCLDENAFQLFSRGDGESSGYHRLGSLLKQCVMIKTCDVYDELNTDRCPGHTFPDVFSACICMSKHMFTYMYVRENTDLLTIADNVFLFQYV